ncbi:uncharacterized protein [Bemisia tabaci]|uniref:uncharacterized protein isoform X1 n=1 Tax=Bemisia tabaci TaxID=7038 RepID=UPI003B285379
MFRPAFIVALLVSYLFKDTVCSEWWNLQHGASVEIKYENASFDTNPEKLQDLQALQFPSKNFQGTEAEKKGHVHHAGPDILGVEGFLPENSNQEKQPRIEVPPRSVAPDDRNLFNFESALGFEKKDSTDVASELSGAKGPSTSMTEQMTGIDWWVSQQRSSQIKHEDEDATFHADPGKFQDQKALQFSAINVRGTKIEIREEIINENPLLRAENSSRQVYRAGSSVLEIIGLLREHPNLEIHPKITDLHHFRYSVPSKPQNGNISVLKPAPELGIPDSKVGFSEFSNTRASKAGQLTRVDGADRETNSLQPLRISLSSLDSDAEPGTDFPVGLNTRAYYGTETLRRAVSSTVSYSQSLLTDYLKSSLNLPQVDRVRNLIGNPLLRPILERMIPQPLTEIPYNVHDDVGGIFLRVLLSRKEGPDVLNLIKLIAKNVSVVKEKGKVKYRINAVCLLMSSRKILKSSLFSSSSSSKDSSSSLSSSSSSSASLERSKSDSTQLDMIRSKNLSRSLGRSLNKRLGGSFGKSFGGNRSLSPSPSTRVEYEFGDSKTKEGEVCKVDSMSNLQKYMRAKKPKGFEDGVGGMFLKCAVFCPDAPLYLDTLKAVVNNVRIEKLPEKSGKLKSHYHIDFLGFAKSPGISPLLADIPGIPGELIRTISEGSSDQSQDSS